MESPPHERLPNQIRSSPLWWHLVIKGLPDLPPQDILDDIKKQNLNCIKVAALISKRGSPPVSPSHQQRTFLSSFDANADIKAIRKIKYICSIRVHWEKFKNARKVAQCRRCQLFGHGTLHCRNPPKCVKCIGEQLTSSCTKQPEQEVQCTNCKGNHPANYSACPVYLKHVEKLENRKKPYIDILKTELAKIQALNDKANFQHLKTTSLPKAWSKEESRMENSPQARRGNQRKTQR